MASGPPWDRKGPCASPMPTRPESVVSLTMSSLTRLIVEVEVRTGWGSGADRKYVSRALIFMASSPLLGRARELEDLAGAEHLHRERTTRRHADQRVSDLLDVVLGINRDALDRENDVAAHGDLLPSDGDDPVAALQAHLPRHRVLGDRLDEERSGRRDVENCREAAGEQHALEGTPEHFPGDQEASRALGCHDKAQAIATARL